MYKTKVVNGQTVPDWDYVCFYKGTLSGTTLSNLTLVWSSTGSDQTFGIGDTVDLSYTSGYGEDLYAALSTHLDQDGTLKADSVDVTAVIKDNVVSNAKLSEFKPTEVISDFIYSGGVVAQSAGLVGTFSNMVHYINGVRCTKTSVPNKTYTASKDTYVDADATNNSTVVYTEVANGAASPALSANHIRVAKVVTNGSAITSVTQKGFDSLGNAIYNRQRFYSHESFLMKQATATTGISALTADVNNLTFTFAVPVPSKAIIQAVIFCDITSAGVVDAVITITDNAGTQLTSGDSYTPGRFIGTGTAVRGNAIATGVVNLAANTIYTYKIRAGGTGGQTYNVNNYSYATVRIIPTYEAV